MLKRFSLNAKTKIMIVPKIKKINLGKKNFELLNAITANKHLTRKELVALVVSHEYFIFKKLAHAKKIAWELITTAKKSKIDKAYIIKEDNIGKKRLYILDFELRMVPA